MGSTHMVNAICVMAHTILKKQGEAIECIKKKRRRTCVLHWELDATPQYMQLQEPETIAGLSRGPVRDEAAAKRGTREVLVQRGLVITEQETDVVFAKPRIMGDETSGTLLDATLGEMAERGCDLQTLAGAFDEVLLHLGVDGAATCELVVDYIKCLVAIFPNVIVVSPSFCFMHGLNRVTADHSTKSRLNLNSLFSLTKMMYIGTYFDTFVSKMVDVAVDDIEWHRNGGPAADDVEVHNRLVKLALPDLHLDPRRQKDVIWALKVLNMRWSGIRLGHCCFIDPVTGLPCCDSISSARKKIKRAVVILLCSAKPPIPCTTRWLTVVCNIGWWWLGFALNTLFPRAWLAAYPRAARALRVQQAALDNGRESDDNAEDSYQVKIGKRMGRGRRSMSDEQFDNNMAFSLTSLSPLHRVMAVAMKSSKGEEPVSICAMAKSVNRAMTELCGLLSADVSDAGGLWFAMHAARAGAGQLASQQQRRYMRKEMHRTCGNFAMRVVDPLDEPDLHLFQALEVADNDDDPIIAEAARQCKGKECCLTAETRKYFAWLRSATVPRMRLVKKAWVPFILKTERDHAGNQRRQGLKSQRARCWRRQSAAYICVRAKHRWANGDKAHLQNQRRLSKLPWGSFRSKMAASTDKRRR